MLPAPTQASTAPAGAAPGITAPLTAAGLRRTFLDLYGRPPVEEERRAWIGRARSELVDAALAGEEFWQNWLEDQLYYFLLIDNFRPATEGVQAIPADLAHNRLTAREALHRICISSSFDRRNPGPDTFVSVVMEQLLGLTVQKVPRELEIGKRLYDGGSGTFLGSTGSSQADVVHIAISDSRTPRHLLAREYERWLREPSANEDLAAWTKQLERDEHSFGAIVRGWFLSPAYERSLARRVRVSNRMYVRALHVDLMDRLPEESEAQRLRSALDGLADSAPLRSLLARLMLDSGRAQAPKREAITDPAVWIRGLFERLLGRLAGEAELSEFLTAFRDPACRPATVLYAIVSHPEYQTW